MTYPCKQHVSRHEGDLEAKCYFARQKLIWEFLESGLKSKIEIPWSHIKGLKVTYPETGDGTLDIEVILYEHQEMFSNGIMYQFS